MIEKLQTPPQPKSKPKALIVLDDVGNAENKPDKFTKKYNNLVNKNFEQDIELRKHFSWATFGLICTWMAIVALLLTFSNKSDGVMIALISGATVQIIGLYYIVLRYIFPNGDAD